MKKVKICPCGAHVAHFYWPKGYHRPIECMHDWKVSRRGVIWAYFRKTKEIFYGKA